MENLNNNGGSFAKLLSQLSTKLDKKEEIDANFMERLQIMLKENGDYLEKLQQQDRKGIMRQLLNLDSDWYMSKVSLDNARKKEVISGDLYASLSSGETFDIATASQEEKRRLIELHLIDLSNTESVVYRLKAAIEFYNTAIEEKLLKRKTFNSELTISFEVKNLPKHREVETIFGSLAYDFLKRGDDGSAVFLQPDDEEIKSKNIGVKTQLSYNRQTRRLNVTLKVVENKGKEDEKLVPHLSFIINGNATAANLINEINKQYLVKSSIIKDDFENELELISNLYTTPLASLLTSIAEAPVTEKVKHMQESIYGLQKELIKHESKAIKKRNVAPLFKAWLSIIEGNAQATGVGQNEKIHRIQKQTVIERYFGGDETKYNLRISEGTPSQSPLTRQIWVIRVDFGTIDKPYKIDFLLTKYGKTRKEIWVPIDKEYIAPIAFANEFERSHNIGKQKFYKGMRKDSHGIQIVSGASSNKQFDVGDIN